MGQQLLHRFKVEGRTGKLDGIFPASFCKRREKVNGEFPVFPGPVSRAFSKDFRSEELFDLKKLEFNGVASNDGSRVDKAKASVEITVMVGC